MTSPFDPRDHHPAATVAHFVAQGIDPGAVRRFLAAWFPRAGDANLLDPRAPREPDDPFLPGGWASRRRFPRRLLEGLDQLPRLKLESIQVSPRDRFEKLLFRTNDGLPVETVLIPLHKENAVSLCVSSQSGCPMACAFCATARLSRRRNLAAWEIVDQILQARARVELQGRRVTGCVFMGMGEPFLNYERVMTAAEILRSPIGLAVSAKAITISTVGLVAEIDRFTREQRPYRLSISLGAADDATRAQLVPVAARTPLRELIAAARRHQHQRGGRINLSYVCIANLNTSETDARNLGRLLEGLPVRFNLIDVTDPTGRFHPPSPAQWNTFRDALRRHLPGQPIVRRYSGGADIQAACGTLAGTSSPPQPLDSD